MGFSLTGFPMRVRIRSPPRTESRTVSAAAAEPSREKQRAVALGRRIMVVVDPSREAKAALQWALSHAVQSQDTIVLVDVIKPSMHGDRSAMEKDATRYALLCAMKTFCQSRRPEVEVETSLVEGRERGPAIIEEVKRRGASLLVLGRKKRSVAWRLTMMWACNRWRDGGGRRGGVVDYCIKNSSCLTLAVRRKSRGGGGYLITSRRHNDFWLLA